jgi:hypothetical protein
MDYCSACRRHLNGALVCPGCGAYAPDIAPSAPRGGVTYDSRAAVDAAPGYGYEEYETYKAYEAYEVQEASEASEAPEAEGTPDVHEVPTPAPHGRAARRRQLARWKKQQRRAVVATAVALVGGGLTIATMDRGGGDRAQAATAPENPDLLPAHERAPEHIRPSADRPDGQAPSRTSRSSARTADVQNRQAPAAASGMTTAASQQQYAAAAPAAQTAPAPQAQARTTTPVSGTVTPDRTVTEAQIPQTPPPADSTGSTAGGTGTTQPAGSTGGETTQPSDGTGTDTPQTNPPTAATSPTEICLLVVCLG